MYSVSVFVTCSYGHRLMGYQGDCAHPHGHNGTIIATVSTESLNTAGLVVDFKTVKAVVKSFVDQQLDHRMVLRQGDPLIEWLEHHGEPVTVLYENPTAEVFARWIYDTLRSQSFLVKSVTFYETETSYATYTGEES